MPDFIGEAKLVLIPKVESRKYAKDFRPISCCNIIYKGLAKLLSTRLKQVLRDLIHQNQGAFVKDRELIFNVLTF